MYYLLTLEDAYSVNEGTLNDNKLRILPESFGSFTVSGDLSLSYNQLTTLPESFGSLTVGGDLYLRENQMTTLPENFPNVNCHVATGDFPQC